ncbi:MAG: hypothetical protein V2I39_06910 [Erythrobacter sp.]|nr:hypothetical protein [Erythrobacter sp.]
MRRARIEQRLAGYWKMEAANVVLVPAIALILAASYGWTLGAPSYFAMVPTCLLLAIGAHYWRAKLAQLRSGEALPRGIGFIARLQWPSAALTGLAAVIAGASWSVPGLAASQADRWVSAVLALLAGLEYVNYYHRQVQHFDHWPDFLRLLAGHGFRRSQMAVDIARWHAAAPGGTAPVG